jgi:hypothetical protein
VDVKANGEVRRDGELPVLLPERFSASGPARGTIWTDDEASVGGSGPLQCTTVQRHLALLAATPAQVESGH